MLLWTYPLSLFSDSKHACFTGNGLVVRAYPKISFAKSIGVVKKGQQREMKKEKERGKKAGRKIFCESEVEKVSY